MPLHLTEEELQVVQRALNHFRLDEKQEFADQRAADNILFNKIAPLLTIIRERKAKRETLQEEYNVIRRQDWQHPRLNSIKRQIEAIDRLSN